MPAATPPVVDQQPTFSPLVRRLSHRSRLAALGFLLVSSSAAFAATRYVNGTSGADSADGLAPTAAWRTLQRACDAAQPGDTVRVAPGVYFEHPRMTRSGTATAPIVFRAEDPAAKATIVSGANVAIRSGLADWTLEDASLQLYSTPVGEAPVSVLADDVNLYGYVTLGELRSFNVANVAGTGKAAPGPLQGFAWESGRLYVRLSAQYGAVEPARRVMKVSTARGGGGRGDEIVRPQDYNWSIETLVPANVVLEGFTFETPGFTGVWIKAGGVTVRGCWFYGCRTGVRGWDHAEERPVMMSDDVIVENCDYSLWPAYEDVMQVVGRAEALTAPEQAALPAFFWWHRKGGARTEEIGIVTAAGRRWKLLGNYISSCLDAVSFMSVGWSEDTEIAYNVFDRVFDNAVECENHAIRLRAHHNTVIDTFEPFSYQPIVGPYPDDITYDHNLVTYTPTAAAFWRKPILKWTPGCVKVKPPAGFTSVPSVPMRVFNNTFDFPIGNMLTAGSVGEQAGGFEFYNNVIIARGLQTGITAPRFAQWIISHNIVAPTVAGAAGPGALGAGTGGLVMDSAAALGLVDFAGKDYRLTAGSVAAGAGIVLPQVPGMSADAGAFPLSAPTAGFQDWRFHYFHSVLMDEAVSGPNADPDGDGAGNLTEFQAGRNPLVADGGPVITPLPIIIGPPLTPRPPVFNPGPMPPTIPLAANLMAEDFADGDRSHTGGSDAAWWVVSAPNKGTNASLSVVDDTAGLDTGSALFVDNAADPAQTASKSLVAAFPAQTLSALGQTLTLSFDFRFAKIAASAADNFFRFGFYDAGGNAYTADSQYKTPGHTGYLASLNFGTLGAVPTVLYEDGAEGNVNSGSDVRTIGSLGSAALAIPAGNTRTSATLTCTRRMNGLEIRLRLANAAGATLLDATTLHAAAQWSFSEVIFSTSRSEADYFLDNIRVASSTAP